VRCYLDDEIRVKGRGDAIEQRNGRDDTASLEAGEGWLSHPSSVGDVNLGETESQAPVADGLPDQEGALCLGVPLAEFLAAAAAAREFLDRLARASPGAPDPPAASRR
jgi:hypothetical protein